MTFSVPLMRISFAAVVLSLLSACSTLVQVPQSLPAAAAMRVTLLDAERGYARVLQTHVNAQGEVDFAVLRDDGRNSGIRALENYVAAIAVTPFDAAPTADARLAHMIDAYNALSMYNVIASNISRSHNGWAKVKFFCAAQIRDWWHHDVAVRV